MSESCRYVPRVALMVLGLVLCGSSAAIAQRADRASISGVVADAQESPVPGATVSIRNQATGVTSVLVTNSSGAYTSPRSCWANIR